MECKITSVILDPTQRLSHLNNLQALDGISGFQERENTCYCALPLTGLSNEQKDLITKEHEAIKQAIKEAGIEVLDPKDSPGNPWHGLKHKPEEIYDVDTIQTVISRFFEFTNIAPSTGAGIEQQKAIMYNKIAVIITKSGIFTSRMSTGARRAIVLEYSDLEKQKDQIRGVFAALKEFETGVGVCSIHRNVLIGYKTSGDPICLKGLIEEKFPDLVYNFDKYKK